MHIICGLERKQRRIHYMQPDPRYEGQKQVPEWLQQGLGAALSELDACYTAVWGELDASEKYAEVQREATLSRFKQFCKQERESCESALVKTVSRCRADLESLNEKSAKVPDYILKAPVKQVSAPWLVFIKKLESNHAEIDAVIKQRSKRLSTITKRIQQVVIWLAEPSIECQQVLTLENISSLEQVLQSVEARLESRCQQVSSLGKRIEDFFSSLGQDTHLLSEKEYLFVQNYKTSPENFVAPNFIGCMERCSENLQELILERNTTLTFIKSECQQLWALLQVPEDTQQHFTTQWDGITEADINAWQQECTSRRNMRHTFLLNKAANIMTEIKSVEDALSLEPADLERLGGSYKACSDDFTVEELIEHVSTLEAHQARLEEVHSARNKIDTMLVKMRELCKQEIELKQIESDPNRFKLRGAKALRETALRRRINEHLPPLEKELRAEVAEYEGKYNLPVRFEQGSLKEWLEKRESDRTALRRHYGAKLPALRQAIASSIQPASRSRSLSLETNNTARSVSSSFSQHPKPQIATRALSDQSRSCGVPTNKIKNETTVKTLPRQLSTGASIKRAITGTFRTDKIDSVLFRKKADDKKSKSPLRPIVPNSAGVSKTSGAALASIKPPTPPVFAPKAANQTPVYRALSEPARPIPAQKENTSVYREKLCAILERAQRKQMTQIPAIMSPPSKDQKKDALPLASTPTSPRKLQEVQKNRQRQSQRSPCAESENIKVEKQLSPSKPVNLVWPLESHWSESAEGGDLSFDPQWDQWRKRKIAERNEKYSARQDEIDAGYRRIKQARPSLK